MASLGQGTGRSIAVGVTLLVVLSGTAAPALAQGGPTVPTQGSGSTAEREPCSFPVTVQDATGANVTLSEPPGRVVPLDGATAQTLREVGAWDGVVAVPPEASYLNGTDGLPRVATNGTVSPDNVAGLTPDLVIAPRATPSAVVERLRDREVRVYVLGERRTRAEIADRTRRIGRLVDACDGAARTVEWMGQNLDNVGSKQALVARSRAMYVAPNGSTAGNGTYVNTVFEQSLLVNVMGEAGLNGTGVPQPALVRELDPAWYVVHEGATNVTDRPGYRDTTAARSNQTVAVDPVYLTQPGPRSLVRATFAIATTVYSVSITDEAYVPRSEVNATATPPPESGSGLLGGVQTYAQNRLADESPNPHTTFFLTILVLAGVASFLVIVDRWRNRP